MLHLEVNGTGPELVLVHGWGMHSGVWREWRKQLGRRFRVTVMDLPGHGGSPFGGELRLADWAEAVLEVAPRRAWWTGWSLGGLVALAAAQQAPERLRGVVLLASTPRFVAAADWPAGMRAELLDGFAAEVAANPNRTLARFMALQTRGAAQASDTLRLLRGELARGRADPAALAVGLRFLRHADLRDALQTLNMPVFALLGARDGLVRADVSQGIPQVRAVVIEQAGHVPFLSHPGACCRHLEQWLLDGEGWRRHEAG